MFTIPTILGGKGDDRLRERIFIGSNRRQVALNGPRLPSHSARQALRNTEPFLQQRHRLPASLGAHQFGPANSLSIAFSSDNSATSFFSRVFSRSRSLNFFA